MKEGPDLERILRILEKLEASNRAEAVSKATQMGLIGGE